MLVQAPVLMIMSRPVALRMVSRRVPSQALMRIFSTMKSPACGSRPRTGAPAPAHHGFAVDEAFEQRRVQSDTGRARLDDEPDMDDDDAARARRGGEAPASFDHPLLPGMRGCAGLGESTAIHDYVVLHVLDDHGAAAWVNLHILAG